VSKLTLSLPHLQCSEVSLCALLLNLEGRLQGWFFRCIAGCFGLLILLARVLSSLFPGHNSGKACFDQLTVDSEGQDDVGCCKTTQLQIFREYLVSPPCNYCQDRFSSTILLGGPGMQGTNEEVSPDTSRCWLVRTIKSGSYGRSPGTREALGVSPGFCGVSPDRGKVVRS